MREIDNGLGEYARKRASLIAAERVLRFDAATTAAATDNEKRAVEIVNNLRVREADEIWHASRGMLMDPSMGFLTAKDIIMSTELYQIMKQLPKGGLLRGHMNTMCDVEFIYKVALEYPAIHIRVDSRVTPDDPLPLPEFKPLSPDLIMEYTKTPSLTCTDYIPGTWVPLGKARSEFSYGGPEAFDKWIVGSLALGANEGSRDHDTLAKARKKFMSAYRLGRGIVCYEPILKRLLRRILLSLVEDGLCYAEIRINFSYKMDIRSDGSETLSHRDYLTLFGEAVQEIKNLMKSEGREDEFMGAKLIYTVYRTFNKTKLRWYLEDCMALKTEFPDLIAGFDFLGPEHRGRPLAYYIEPLMWFQQETKKRELDIPFIFLVGEPMGDEAKADSNLYDALLLGTKRIGHGVNLAKHPLLMQMTREMGVAVEVCPVSNEVLGLTSSLHHPLTTFLNHGVPVVLCPDNPASYGYAGLSFDFFQAIVGSNDNHLLSLKQLAKQSLEYSSLSVEDKKRAFGAWEKRWTVFVDKIVDGNIEYKQ
ncbi:unnamed protein product [Rhizoctonia solani]|uniref:adenosine deaminase n=1 Tax=Rhizoctonia solani TaxID=456999 RepID=A0A8H3BD05_9AGAM|nr:unnamed protein product [Rhizoctonia solani]